MALTHEDWKIGQQIPIIVGCGSCSYGVAVAPLLVPDAFLRLSSLSSGWLSYSLTIRTLSMDGQLNINRNMNFLGLHE
jgi:hypothetical protein